MTYVWMWLCESQRRSSICPVSGQSLWAGPARSHILHNYSCSNLKPPQYAHVLQFIGHGELWKVLYSFYGQADTLDRFYQQTVCEPNASASAPRWNINETYSHLYFCTANGMWLNWAYMKLWTIVITCKPQHPALFITRIKHGSRPWP